MSFFGPREVCSLPLAANRMMKSATSAWLMKCFVPLTT